VRVGMLDTRFVAAAVGICQVGCQSATVGMTDGREVLDQVGGNR